MSSWLSSESLAKPFFFYVPERGRDNNAPMSYSTVDIPQRRRGVGPLSCRECRRLKLKCNRQFPCTSCERRGCASVCPNGIVEAGRGSRRHILATTSQLQETVRCLEARVSELEAALEESHAMHTSSPHPLLQDHRTTQSHTTDAHSTYVPPAYGQLVPSPPAITIPSTSPSAHSPTYAINNTSPDTSHIPQSFNPYDLSDLPQRPLSSGGNGSSSSSSDFNTYVPSSYTTSNIRADLSGRQQGRMTGHPQPDLSSMYDSLYPSQYYQNPW